MTSPENARDYQRRGLVPFVLDDRGVQTISLPLEKERGKYKEQSGLPDQIARINRFWGDDSWRAGADESRRGLFGDMIEKKTNDAVIQAYKRRLKEKAGFEYVPDPIPMKNIRGAAVYYLFFASNNKTGYKIAKAIFKKYR